MVGDDKNSENFIKDTPSSIASYDSKNTLFIFNTKTNKLITALYMVTEIMDKDEPLRVKLRLAGADILSDMHIISYKTDVNLINKNVNKISEIVSFLEIASTIRMISEMNFNILKKEFLNLRDSLIKYNNPILLEDFLKSDDGINQNIHNAQDTQKEYLSQENKKENINGHSNIKNSLLTTNTNRARIGVQKGSTLMKAIKDIKTPKKVVKPDMSSSRTNFDNLKKERRNIIIKIIKDKKEATISDIKASAFGSLASCGEKTLQRELISMVADGVLKKAGEKRWSRYFL